MKSEKKSPSQDRIKLSLISLFSLLAFGTAAYLALHFYELRGGVAGFSSLCNVNSSMNCDVVSASPYSELFAGIPLASFAAGWMLSMFFISLFARSFEWRAEAVRFLTGMSVFGGLTSLIYLAIMLTQIKTACLFCILLDVFQLLILILLLSFRPKSFRHQPVQIEHAKTFSLVTLIVLFVSVVLFKSQEGRTLPDSEIREIVQSTLASPALPIQIHSNSLILGDPLAPITIVEFSDFQCPFCRLGAMGLHTVLQRYPKSVRVVLKPFPLDQACNRTIDRPMHAHACEAAAAVVCAQPKGKFKELYEKIFEKQAELAPGKVIQWASSLGLTGDFQDCLKSPDTRFALSRDIEEGIQLGVKSTPTFYINGHPVMGLLPPPVWFALIDQILKSTPSAGQSPSP